MTPNEHSPAFEQPGIVRQIALVGSLIGIIGLLFALVARSRARRLAPAATGGQSAVLELPEKPGIEPRAIREMQLWAARLVGLVAVGCMMYAAWNWRVFIADDPLPLDTGAIFMLAGGAALGLAWLLAGNTLPGIRVGLTVSSQIVKKRSEPSYIHRTAALTGALALLVVAEINGSLLGVGIFRLVSQHIQFLLFCSGIVLVVWGLAGKRMPFVETTSLKKRNREIPAIAAILLLAVILRTYRLEDALHIFMDEMHFVDAVTLLRDFDNVELLHPVDGLAQFPRVFPYLQLIGVDIFGPTLVGIRVVSVAMGVLGVAALYLLAKTLFDRKTALLASFLLATFPPHLHYSRLAMNNIGDPLFGTLMLAFLTRGLKTGRRVDFTLAGASLGLTQYFYEGGRLLYPGLLIAWLAGWWLIELLQRRRIPFNVSLLRSLALMAVTALIIALPYYYTLFGMNFALMPRMEGMGMGSDYLKGLLSLDGALLQDFLLYRVKLPLLHYVFRPDGGHFFYGGETALILPYLVPAFLLGIFTALWRLPKPGILLLLWLLLTALGNALIITPDWTARFVVVFPALALTTAVGMRYVLALVWPTDLLVRTRCGTFLQKKVFLLGGIFILLAAGYAQVNYYFGPHLAINNREVRLTPKDVHDAMFRTRALPPGTQVYLITPLEEVYYPQVSGMIAFWKLDIRVGVWAPDEDLPSRIESLSNEIDRAFFVYPADTDTIALLRQKFPRLRGPEFSPYNTPGDKQYALYYAPRDR